MVGRSEHRCSRCGEPVGTSIGGSVCAACFFEDALGGSEANDAPLEFRKSDSLKRFGPYELLEEVGRGGMGVIYRARQPALNRIVALKMLIGGEFADDAARKRLLREARAVAKLSHQNIVNIHEVGEHDGHPYFAMEYVAGRNLAQILEGGPLSVAHIADLVRKLALAVHYAHKQGVIHRDLKPANVLLDERGEPKLTDFGLTKTALDPTQTMASAGSPNFMAPEQASRERGPTGIHTDVFGLGAILYFLLTGKPPFEGEMLGETMRAVLDEDPPEPRTIRRDIPADLETICLKCLRKAPAQRYQTAIEIAEDLERLVESRPIRARPVGAIGRLGHWCRREPFLAAALGLCVTLGVLVMILAKLQRSARLEKKAFASQFSQLPSFVETVQAGLAVGRHPLAAVVEDFNHDGWLDLACISREEHDVQVFFGTQERRFKPGPRYNLGRTPEALAKSDVNHDGNFDLIGASGDSNSLTVLLGKEDGEFAEAPGSPISAGLGPKEVVVADFNKDTHPDLVVADFKGNALSVFYGDGTGRFRRTIVLETGIEPWGIGVGDLNRDGWPDIVNTDVFDGTVRVWLSQKDEGGFSLRTDSILKAGRRPFHLALADLDGDGRLDIVTTATDDNLIHIFFQAADGRFSERGHAPLGLGGHSYWPRRINTEDLNRDGFVDFVVANESDSFTVFIGNGRGQFRVDSQRPYPCGDHVISAIITDLNKDQWPDIVVLSGWPQDKQGNVLFFMNQIGSRI